MKEGCMTATKEQLQVMVDSLQEQLADLYAEKTALPVPMSQVANTISSLEQQVIALVDEKMELQKEMAQHLKTIASLKK